MPWLVLRIFALKDRLVSRAKTHGRPKPRTGAILALSFFMLLVGRPVHAYDPEPFLQGFADFSFSIASAITKGIVLLIDAMIPIMTYNNFVGNPVVKAGWAIVRDTVNMFFVVILIIIAFGTIFGNKRFQWQQQVPRLLIMAIVINFSKTLCGIMIDFGQVIMLTFANALREVAAGNFIQLLGLNQIYSHSSTSIKAAVESGTGSGSSFDYLAAGIMSVFLTVWVFGTLLILTAILLFRIIMLWILVVIAPLAWFVKGAEGIIQSNAYAEWWSEFKCLVGIGPILTFFLWLTLTVAGAGTIAANSGFDVTAGSNNANFTNSIFELNNFLSFLIGMAMIFAGFKVATQFCSGVSGAVIGKALGVAKSIPAMTVGAMGAASGLALKGMGAASGLALKGGAKGVQLGARGVMAAGGGLKAGAKYVLPSSVISAPGRASAAVRGGLYGKAAQMLEGTGAERYFKGKQLDVAQASRAKQFEGVDKEKESMKDKDRVWKQSRLEAIKDLPPTSKRGKDQAMALIEEMMGDERLQKDLGSDAVEELWKQFGGDYKKMSKGSGAKTAAITGFEKKNADFVLKGMPPADQEEWLKNNIKDFDDVKGLRDGAVEDEAVRKHLEGMRSGHTTKDGKPISAYDAVLNGYAGDAKSKVLGKADVKAKTDAAVVGDLDFEQLREQMGRAVEHEDEDAVDGILEVFETRYTAGSDQDRHQMAIEMDRMQVALERGKSKSTFAGVAALAFTEKRAEVERGNGYGAVPAPSSGESADTYVKENFGGASKVRMEAATVHLKVEKDKGDKAVTKLEGELEGLKTGDKTTNDQVTKKQKQMEEIENRIKRQIEPELEAAYAEVRAAEQLLAEAQKGGDVDEKRIGTEELAKAKTGYEDKKAEAKNLVENDADLKTLVTEIEGLVTKAGGTAARAQEIATKSRELADARSQAAQLDEVVKRLEDESAKRTT